MDRRPTLGRKSLISGSSFPNLTIGYRRVPPFSKEIGFPISLENIGLRSIFAELHYDDGMGTLL
jgi:hypothetical protein